MKKDEGEQVRFSVSFFIWLPGVSVEFSLSHSVMYQDVGVIYCTREVMLGSHKQTSKYIRLIVMQMPLLFRVHNVCRGYGNIRFWGCRPKNGYKKTKKGKTCEVFHQNLYDQTPSKFTVLRRKKRVLHHTRYIKVQSCLCRTDAGGVHLLPCHHVWRNSIHEYFHS